MTKEQLAEKLNGRDSSRVVTWKEHEEIENHNLLVIYGLSDDCLEFRGAIYDELGAYEGTTVYLTPKGDIKRKKKDNRVEVSAIWCPKIEEEMAWLIEVDVPHATFDIMEEDELFCRGVVLDLQRSKLKLGIELIAEERKRQIEVEGWTPEHDDHHVHGEIAIAAACYAHPILIGIERLWPWANKWWKPSPDDRIKELKKAGALIAAEIDRINRLEAKKQTQL